MTDDDKAPSFSYSKVIKSPVNFNAGPGSGQFTENIRALNSYTDLLLTSNTDANCLRPRPLGSQFFLKTKAKCIDKNSNEQVSRYIYVSHQPETSVSNPVNSTDNYAASLRLDGLIPGIITNMLNLNIFGIFSAFSENDNPECVLVELSSTRALPEDVCFGSSTALVYDTHFITLADVKNVDACSFSDGKNPYNKTHCQYNVEGLENMSSIPKDSLVYLYYSLFGVLGLYVLFHFLKKQNQKR